MVVETNCIKLPACYSNFLPLISKLLSMWLRIFQRKGWTQVLTLAFVAVRPLCVISGGSVWRHIERHRGLHNQPRVPCGVRQQPGLHVVHPVGTGGHDSSRLQRFPVGGQVRLPGNQRDRSTKHMVRYLSFIYSFVCFVMVKKKRERDLLEVGLWSRYNVIHQANIIHFYIHLHK